MYRLSDRSVKTRRDLFWEANETEIRKALFQFVVEETPRIRRLVDFMRTESDPDWRPFQKFLIENEYLDALQGNADPTAWLELWYEDENDYDSTHSFSNIQFDLKVLDYGYGEHHYCFRIPHEQFVSKEHLEESDLISDP